MRRSPGNEQKITHAPRISRKNQITIPVGVLKKLNLGPGDRLQMITESDGSIRLIPKRNVPDFRRLIGAVPMLYKESGEMLDDLRGKVEDD